MRIGSRAATLGRYDAAVRQHDEQPSAEALVGQPALELSR
jgi:hypothetical protein